MIRTFVPLRRIAALSVAITLVVVPIASAQTPAADSPGDASAGPVFLSPAAFARLVQPPPADVAPVPVVADSLRPSLLRHGTAAMARQAQGAPAKAPQQKSWASRHKTALIVWSAIAGGLVVLAGCLSGRILGCSY